MKLVDISIKKPVTVSVGAILLGGGLAWRAHHPQHRGVATEGGLRRTWEAACKGETGIDAALDPEAAEDREARALVGALLRPDMVDWSKRTDPRDSDGDGRVSKEEAPERMQRFFDRIDSNGDGMLDQDELEEMRSRRRPE